MRKIGIYICFILLLLNCKKEIGPQNIDNSVSATGNLIILNEGNFGQGNASVSVYNKETKEISNTQFKSINGFGIGDVLQSVNRFQDKFYFVVNNSGKIVVTDTNLNYISEIIGFNSPRYIEFFNGKGFVTDLKQKAVYVVDINSNQIINQIKTEGWTEQLLIHQNKLLVLDRGDYLNNSSPNHIFIIDPYTLVKEDSIVTSVNPNSMVLDKNNNLWVLTSGKSSIENPKLSVYSIATKSLLKTYNFTNSSSPSRLIINNTNDELYFINNSLYKMKIGDSLIPTSSFYSKTIENFYGLYYDNKLNEIYITDAKSFNQSGHVFRLNENSTKIDDFSTGIIPQFLF